MLPSTPLAVDKLTEELVNGPAHRRRSTGGQSQVSGAADQRAGEWEGLLRDRGSWRAFISKRTSAAILAIMNTSLNGNLSSSI